jgi:hypothetical protein
MIYKYVLNKIKELEKRIEALEQEPCTVTEFADRCRECGAKYGKYKKAFKVACELLNGAILYGYDSDRIFSEIMEKDGIVSSFSYEEFILNNLDRLTGSESENKKYEAKVITRGKCMMCGKELTEGLFFCKECGDKANSKK